MTFAHLDDVLALTADLGHRFDQAGYRLYLVGGIVRDQWLGAPVDASADLDLTTDAIPTVIRQIVEPMADALWTQGERFGTIGLRIGSRLFEITTHRRESYTSDSRKPEVAFGRDLSVDLSRRDFTINAMAVDVITGDLLDPWGGAKDLAARRLCTPLEPQISFADDPLRMIRAARFASRFDLAVDPDLVMAAADLHDRVQIVAIERIGQEMRRLLALPHPASGLRFLVETGVLAEIVEYGKPERVVSVDSALVAIDCVEAMPGQWQHRLAALLIGLYDDLDGVHAATRRLRLSSVETRFIVSLCRAALVLLDAAPSAPSVRRWATQIAATAADAAYDLAAVVGGSTAQPTIDAHRMIYEQLAELEPLHDVAPALSGNEIVNQLGIEPGPLIGEAVRVLEDHRINHGPLGAEASTNLLKEWMVDRGM